MLKVQPLPDEDVVEWVLKKLECLDLTFLTNFIRLKLQLGCLSRVPSLGYLDDLICQITNPGF